MKNVDVLIKLAKLKKKDLIHDEFDFRVFNVDLESYKKGKVLNCGSIGCLAGELPGVSEDWYFNVYGQLQCKGVKGAIDNMLSIYQFIMEYFDISNIEVYALFTSDESATAAMQATIPDLVYLPPDASLRMVQNNLKTYLKHHGYEV